MVFLVSARRMIQVMSGVTDQRVQQLQVRTVIKMRRERSKDKYKDKDKDKDKDKYKDKDKDKDADRITETLLVCYIFGILMTQAFNV